PVPRALRARRFGSSASYGSSQFVGADRGGADLADDDAGGVVGEDGGFLEGAAGAEGQGAGREDRIPGAGDGEDLARDRREPSDHAAGLEERHALLAAGDEDGLGLPAVEETLAGGVEGRVVVDVDARGLTGLLAVRLHQRRAPVVREVCTLRVD